MGDAQISRQDIMSEALEEFDRDTLKAMFYGFAGGDGQIQLSEISAVFEEMGITLAKGELEQYIAMTDADGGSDMNFVQFESIFIQMEAMRKTGQGGSAHTWNHIEVGEWISNLGFPMYKACFTDQFIDGHALQTVNASKLPRLGITDFEDMRTITAAIRKLFGSLQPNFYRSVADSEWTPRNSVDGCKRGYGQASKETAPYEPTPRWQLQKAELEATGY